MKSLGLLLILLFGTSAVCQDNPMRMRIGEIEFFGTDGMNLEQVRNSLPVREGGELDFQKGPEAIQPIIDAIKQATGSEPTDVNPVCCDDRGDWMIYIGLRGKNVGSFRYNAVPKGSAKLPPEIVSLYRQAMDMLLTSIRKQATEDRSRGYALSSYPPMRAAQLALREYAMHHALVASRVLMSSADAEQRAIAAQVLGYARQSDSQIVALVLASRDADDGVRNNAMRALAVLAESSPEVAARIPAVSFVDMLNSGVWKDRNKGGSLLGVLSARRNPNLLRLLRVRALPSLIEMARWRTRGHADSARMMLGRIAGIEETQLTQLAAAGHIDEIIGSLKRPR